MFKSTKDEADRESLSSEHTSGVLTYMLSYDAVYLISYDIFQLFITAMMMDAPIRGKLHHLAMSHSSRKIVLNF